MKPAIASFAAVVLFAIMLHTAPLGAATPRRHQGRRAGSRAVADRECRGARDARGNGRSAAREDGRTGALQRPRAAVRQLPDRRAPERIRTVRRARRTVDEPGVLAAGAAAGRRRAPGGGRDGPLHAGGSLLPGPAHLHRRSADHRAAARRPELSRAGAARARDGAGAPGLGELEPWRLRALGERRARGLQRVPPRRRLQQRSEAEHAGRAAAGRCDP